MTEDAGLLDDGPEDLFEDAPCGYLATAMDGTLVRVNRTFERWTGLDRADLIGRRRFGDLLAPGGRIFYETHYAPLLHLQGRVREIAVEIVRADGSRLPALVSSVVRHDAAGTPRVIRTTVFDATERRKYEEELLLLRRREREIAGKLQRSLLAGELPTAPGLDLEVVYRSAVAGTEVGGDWYDAFWLEDGQVLALVVGDVVGRGIDAAATMGQLRSALRALAMTTTGPADLLEALDRYATRHRVGRMTTLVYGELHVAERRLRYVCAGHPPPVLVAPDGPARVLWSGRSLPLDAAIGSPPARAQGEERFDPGALLVLYSDGLVERRRETITDGIDRLLGLVEAHRGEPPATLADRAVRALAVPGEDDDECLLVLRLD